MFTSLFLLLSTATLLSGHQIGGRIYGGVDTSIETTPYQVSLQNKTGKHLCGGSIYSRNIIVTAAHCVIKKKARNIYVRAGSDVYNSGGSLIQVFKMSVHKEFYFSTMENDVAVLLLRSPLELGVRVQPISLASSEPKDGASVIVSGWGKTETEKQPIKLKSVNVTIVPREKCAEDYEEISGITEKNICAAAPDKDACHNDSGGPMVHNNELVGIVSWGFECANPDYPGVYVNVALIRNWIIKNAARLDSKVNRNE